MYGPDSGAFGAIDASAVPAVGAGSPFHGSPERSSVRDGLPGLPLRGMTRARTASSWREASSTRLAEDSLAHRAQLLRTQDPRCPRPSVVLAQAFCTLSQRLCRSSDEALGLQPPLLKAFQTGLTGNRGQAHDRKSITQVTAVWWPLERSRPIISTIPIVIWRFLKRGQVLIRCSSFGIIDSADGGGLREPIRGFRRRFGRRRYLQFRPRTTHHAA